MCTSESIGTRAITQALGIADEVWNVLKKQETTRVLAVEQVGRHLFKQSLQKQPAQAKREGNDEQRL